MLSVGYMFVIEESIYEDTKNTLSKYFKIDSVKNFIDLSKKMVQDGVESLSAKEQSTYRGLFEDPAVKDYISAARRAGERDGWIKGGIGGGLAGGVMGSILGGGIGASSGVGFGGTFAMFVALGLLGAAAGGAAIGWGFSNVLSWIRKWQAEDDVIRLGKVGGVVGKTMPIVKTD